MGELWAIGGLVVMEPGVWFASMLLQLLFLPTRWQCNPNVIQPKNYGVFELLCKQ